MLRRQVGELLQILKLRAVGKADQIVVQRTSKRFLHQLVVRSVKEEEIGDREVERVPVLSPRTAP